MKNMFFLFSALLGLATVTAAHANEGFFAGIQAGGNWVNKVNHRHIHVDFDGGYVVGATVGYTWCNDFSLEGEFTYRNNDVDKVKFRKRDCHNNGDCVAKSHDDHDGKHHRKNKRHSSGELRSYAVMANLRWDIPLDCNFTPYIRGGIGYADTKVHSRYRWWDSENQCNRWHRSRSENGFAWQVGAGVMFPIDCNIVLGIGYNFLRAQKDINNNSVTVAANYYF